MLTAGGRGDSARRRELLLVVPRCVTIARAVGGVRASDCESSDLSLPSCDRTGVFGIGEATLSSSISGFVESLSHDFGVSGVMVPSERSCRCSRLFGTSSWG